MTGKGGESSRGGQAGAFRFAQESEEQEVNDQ